MSKTGRMAVVGDYEKGKSFCESKMPLSLNLSWVEQWSGTRREEGSFLYSDTTRFGIFLGKGTLATWHVLCSAIPPSRSVTFYLYSLGSASPFSHFVSLYFRKSVESARYLGAYLRLYYVYWYRWSSASVSQAQNQNIPFYQSLLFIALSRDRGYPDSAYFS